MHRLKFCTVQAPGFIHRLEVEYYYYILLFDGTIQKLHFRVFPQPDSVRVNRVVVVPLTVGVATIAHTYADHSSSIFLKRKTNLKGKHLLRANNAYDLFDSLYYNCLMWLCNKQSHLDLLCGYFENGGIIVAHF
jgi:hypothetical protein